MRAPIRDDPEARLRTITRGTDLLRPAWDFTSRLWVVDNTSTGAQVSYRENGNFREARVPDVSGRTVRSFLVSPDATRYVAVVRGAGGDQLRAGRILFDGQGGVDRAGPSRRIQVEGVDRARITDIAWKSPSVGHRAPPGVPGPATLRGAHGRRRRCARVRRGALDLGQRRVVALASSADDATIPYGVTPGEARRPGHRSDHPVPRESGHLHRLRRIDARPQVVPGWLLHSGSAARLVRCCPTPSATCCWAAAVSAAGAPAGCSAAPAPPPCRRRRCQGGRPRPRPASSHRSRPRSTPAWCGPWCWPTRSVACSTWPLRWVAPRRRRRRGSCRPRHRAGRAGPGAVAPGERALARPRPDPGHHRSGRGTAAGDRSIRHGGAVAAAATRGAGPGRSRRRAAPGQPRRLDAVPEPSPRAARRAAPASPRRGLRRRADHGCHRARGPARARGGRTGGRRDRGGGGDPPTFPRNGKFSGTPFVATRHGLTSVHGVRPGPWLRREGALRPIRRKRSGPASRCQSQAKRPT